MNRTPVRPAALGLLLVSISLPAVPAAGDVFADIGYTALVARLGAANVPTGAGIGCGQVEAQESTGNFGPNAANPQFAGKTFTPMSGPFGSSSHATTVGQNLYGLSGSIAPGVNSIWIWEAGNWATTGYLRTNATGQVPATPPSSSMRIINNSWIGDFGSSTTNNNALRRLDFAIVRDNLVVVNGTNNGAGSVSQPLVAYGYNGITVGVMGGAHANGLTPAGLDGPNRRKPDLVAPNSFTSFSTPVVGAAAALLLETAATFPGLAGNANAASNLAIKASLLAGTTHRAAWTNSPATSGPTRGTTATPLDPLWGADLLNIDRSHQILTGLERDGSVTPPLSPNAGSRGWDLVPTMAPSTSQWWRFRVHATIPELSVLATWHRSVTNTFGSFNLQDFDLVLWRITPEGGLAPLVGDPGVGFFASGNVESASTIDNVEHLFVRGLVAGDYLVELRRKLGTQTALPVAIAWWMPPTADPADLDGDGAVGAADLAILLGQWGGPGSGDLDGDGSVGAADLAVLLGAWG
jgi:hypothetical protein